MWIRDWIVTGFADRRGKTGGGSWDQRPRGRSAPATKWLTCICRLRSCVKKLRAIFHRNILIEIFFRPSQNTASRKSEKLTCTQGGSGFRLFAFILALQCPYRTPSPYHLDSKHQTWMASKTILARKVCVIDHQWPIIRTQPGPVIFANFFQGLLWWSDHRSEPWKKFANITNTILISNCEKRWPVSKS